MKILEYGNPKKEKVVLIHGFQMHLDSLKCYIDILKEKYFVVVPILPGHNTDELEEFESFNKCLEEFEKYYINNHGKKAYAIIGFSMGGVFASYIWKNKQIIADKVIMESSPLLKWNNFMINVMTKQYLSLTKATRERNPKIINQAIKSIVLEKNLDSFLKMMDGMSEQTIIKYLKEVGQFNLPSNIDTPNTKIYYSYGGKINEIVFKKVAKYINKHYSNSEINCIRGKGHCEDAIFNPEEKSKELIKMLTK